MKDGISLPETVKIAGHTYTIKYPYVFTEVGNLFGQCDLSNKDIRICNVDSGGLKRAASGIYVTLIHEMLHAIDNATGQNIFDEPKITAMSEMIYQVLTDNGWLKIQAGIV